METTRYNRCRRIVVNFLAADNSVRLTMVKHSLDDFLLFARNPAPEDAGFRAMLVGVVRQLQNCYARGVTDGASVYLSERPNGLDELDRWPRLPGVDVYDHGHLEDVEMMARAVGYPVHELKDLFVELGVPGQPGYPRDSPYGRAGHAPGSAEEDAANALDLTATGAQEGGEGCTEIHNFCSVVIGEPSPDRNPSPTISEQEREYAEYGLALRHVPYARTPGCPACVRAGRRCIPTAGCCAMCDGIDIRQTLPSTHRRLVHDINTAARSLLSSTNSANAALSGLQEFGPALQRAQTSVKALTDAVRGEAGGR